MPSEIREENRSFCLHSTQSIWPDEHRVIYRVHPIGNPAVHTGSKCSVDRRCLGRPSDRSRPRVLFFSSSQHGPSSRTRDFNLTATRCWRIFSCEDHNLFISKRGILRVDSTRRGSLGSHCCLCASAQSSEQARGTARLEICLSKLGRAAGTKQS